MAPGENVASEAGVFVKAGLIWPGCGVGEGGKGLPGSGVGVAQKLPGTITISALGSPPSSRNISLMMALSTAPIMVSGHGA